MSRTMRRRPDRDDGKERSTNMLPLLVVAILALHLPVSVSANATLQSGTPTSQSSSAKPWPPVGVFLFQPVGEVRIKRSLDRKFGPDDLRPTA